MVISKAVGRSLAACAITIPTTLGVGVPAAHAKNGDTHITGQGIVQTLDCNESTLYVMGTGNTINALGSCWAVTVQGSSNVVVADNVVDNIIVYGNDQTVFYKNGDPTVWDRGRELGMTNRIDRVPA
jgi:Ca2+-binding RTX toxin-like protein